MIMGGNQHVACGCILIGPVSAAQVLGDNLLALIKAMDYRGIPIPIVKRITWQVGSASQQGASCAIPDRSLSRAIWQEGAMSELAGPIIVFAMVWHHICCGGHKGTSHLTAFQAGLRSPCRCCTAWTTCTRTAA